jgi:hypothetical protein
MSVPKWMGLCRNALWILNPFLGIIAYYHQEINFGIYFQWLGKLHPMLLHFPIVLGLGIAGYYIYTKDNKKTSTVFSSLLILHSLLATIVAIFGIFLSKQGSYDHDLIFWHQWGGVAIAWLSWGLMALHEHNDSFKTHFSLRALVGFFFAGVLIFFTHKGAQLTHGSQVLSWPEEEIAKEITVNMDSTATLYERAIGPLLQQKCLSCHGPEKEKGNLLLNSPDHILKGGEHGSILIGQNNKKALLLERLFLPFADEKHMPPEGKLQLTKEELSLLSYWILAGGILEVQMNELTPSDSLFLLADHWIPSIPYSDGPPQTFPDLKAYNSNYCTVNYSYAGSRDIEVSFYQKKFYAHENLKRLAPIQSQIVSLNMQNMPLQEEDIAFIAQCSQLQKLNLNYTQLSADQLIPLKKLTQLKSISICGLAYDENTWPAFFENAPFDEVHLWASSLNAPQIDKIRSAYPQINFTVGDNLKNYLIKITSPIIDQDSSIIKSHLDINIKHFLEGTVIRYTTDGTDPDSLSSPEFKQTLRITDHTTLKTKAFKSGWISSDVVQKTFYRSEIHPDTIYFITQPDRQYPGNGTQTLIDYQLGDQNFSNGKWLGYLDENMILVIGFHQSKKLKEARFNTLIDNASYIFPLTAIQVAGSLDGTQFKALNEIKFPSLQKDDFNIENKSFSCLIPGEDSYKFYKFTLSNLKKLPDWHPGKNTPAWMFIDELFLN